MLEIELLNDFVGQDRFIVPSGDFCSCVFAKSGHSEHIFAFGRFVFMFLRIFIGGVFWLLQNLTPLVKGEKVEPLPL